VGPSVNGGASVAYPGSAGDVVHNRYTINVPASTPVNTVLEIGVIPPGCRVVDAMLESSAVGAGVTCQVGIISNPGAPLPPGSNDTAALAARTCGSEFFAAATAIAAISAARMSAPGGFQVAPVAYERGIGVSLAGATTAASLQSVTLAVWLAAA